MSSLLGEVKNSRMLNIRSSTDRFPGRKFSTSIEGIRDKFQEMYHTSPESVYLLEKVIKCYDIHNTFGNNKFNRYKSSLKKDVYSLPMMLGLNESIKECHQKWIAVYDMSKYHAVALGELLCESPGKVEERLIDYLDSLNIKFATYLNYMVNGVESDVFEKGFSVFNLVNYLSNSYLNLKRIADSNKLSVEELIRLYILKYNELAFNTFMEYMEGKNRKVLVQSSGLDTLVLSSASAFEFEPLVFTYYKNRYVLEPIVFDVNEFNSKIPEYYLNREVMSYD